MKHQRIFCVLLCLCMAVGLGARAAYPEYIWSMGEPDAPGIQITYPLTGNQVMDRHLISFYFDWLSGARALADEDEQLTLEMGLESGIPVSSGAYALTAEHFESGDTVSFLFTEYANRYASVHPFTAYTGKTFRPATGEPVSLTALVAEGQWDALVKKADAALRADEAINEWANSEPGWFMEGLTAMDAFDAFALTGDALIIQFQQYQLCPYALGAPRVEIPLAELAGILR